ncbi:MAG TPA: tetratricopeptide repeat protein [Desulfuromonadales bacterium]|nr:tetratricopeptide repeat protein [Desulfuromonadales bacterium]
MTLMAFLLLIILFLAFFIYFSGLNPQTITINYLPDHSFSHSAAIIVVGAILLGLFLGYAAHLYSTLSYLAKNWKRDRGEKKAREIAAIYRDGVGRFLSGDLKKAHTLLQKAVDRDPSRAETYIALANVHIQEGTAEDGLNLLIKARGIDPRSLEVLFKLAATYEELGRDEEAAKVYQDILAIEADNRKALRTLRDLHVRHGRWTEALDLQKKVLKANPGANRLDTEKQRQLSLRYEVARDALAAGEIEKAKGEFKEIAKIAADFIPAIISLGDAYVAENRPEEAAKIWQDGYRRLGKSAFLCRLEELYLNAEDPSTLLSFYRSLLLERGDDLMLRLFYGKLCLRLEMVDEALEQLGAVESSGADFPQLHILLAEAHRRRNRIDASINEYKKALGIDHRLRFSFACEACGEPAAEWLSRCPSCGTWGSFSLVDRQAIQEARALEVKEIHHGEREEWNEQE